MSLITSYYIDRSEKFKFTVQVYFHMRCFSSHCHQSSASSHVSNHDGSPRPVAPWAKTIHHILPLCPLYPPWQPSPSRLPSPGDVGHSLCVGAHPVPWRDACAWSRVPVAPGQRWREADVHTCMHKQESIKPHVKQAQHVLLPFPIMESFYPHWPIVASS